MPPLLKRSTKPASEVVIPDLISDFMTLTQDAPTPDLFRLWAAIAMVAGAGERRVWLKTARGENFPNLYVLLVAPPGVGKSIVDWVRDLWHDACEPGTKSPAFHVAPDSMTKAALVDVMEKTRRQFLPAKGAPVIYSSLLISAEEISILMPSYDLEFAGTLNAIWNNKRLHEEVRRHGPRQSVRIEMPQITILGGAQPSWLASLPEDVWNSGISRRLLMVYASETPYKDVWQFTTIDENVRGKVLKGLGQISRLYGEMKIELEAIELMRSWDHAGQLPKPAHSKLSGYNTTRYQHFQKLSLISTLSRLGAQAEFPRESQYVITLQDVKRALNWLEGIEDRMPDIFRAMIGKSDAAIIEEMHRAVFGMYARTREPVPGSAIRKFLMERIPHDKVESMLLMAERANLLSRLAGTGGASPDLYVPKPRHEGNIE